MPNHEPKHGRSGCTAHDQSASTPNMATRKCTRALFEECRQLDSAGRDMEHDCRTIGLPSRHRWIKYHCRPFASSNMSRAGNGIHAALLDMGKVLTNFLFFFFFITENQVECLAHYRHIILPNIRARVYDCIVERRGHSNWRRTWIEIWLRYIRWQTHPYPWPTWLYGYFPRV